jgi:hypothetical protein
MLIVTGVVAVGVAIRVVVVRFVARVRVENARQRVAQRVFAKLFVFMQRCFNRRSQLREHARVVKSNNLLKRNRAALRGLAATAALWLSQRSHCTVHGALRRTIYGWALVKARIKLPLNVAPSAASILVQVKAGSHVGVERAVWAVVVVSLNNAIVMHALGLTAPLVLAAVFLQVRERFTDCIQLQTIDFPAVLHRSAATSLVFAVIVLIVVHMPMLIVTGVVAVGVAIRVVVVRFVARVRVENARQRVAQRLRAHGFVCVNSCF